MAVPPLRPGPASVNRIECGPERSHVLSSRRTSYPALRQAVMSTVEFRGVLPSTVIRTTPPSSVRK
jgi:hypothetical protein